MRAIFVFITLLFPGLLSVNSPEPFPALSTECPLIWKTKMGRASFKTNIETTSEYIIIGSNGQGFMDINLFDKESGMYVIDRRSGRIIHHFANECLGDMDVNGVLLYNDRCYFGNDNEEFLCTDIKGKVLWRNPTSGDIEHQPLLLNRKNGDVVVYASESGEVKAVNPINGKTIWSYFTPDYTGYKIGDNRMLFKVEAYFSNTQSFYVRPVSADLNQDGQKDLVYITYDNKIYAINGVTGSLLWQYTPEENANLSYDIALSGNENNPLLSFVEEDYSPTYTINSRLVTLSRSGHTIFSQKIKTRYFETGLNYFRTKEGNILLNTSDSLFTLKEGKIISSIYHDMPITDEENREKNSYSHSRNSRQPLFAERPFPYEGHENCILILNQYDRGNYDNGFVEIIDTDNSKVLKRFSLPESSEMQPQIMDINKDGFLDILVNCSDGYLYCYNLKIKA